MKSVIPFTKELDFAGKVSEITSISLEREFEINETAIDGNLFVTGDYKSHEVSANVIPFSFKIPFTIEIPDNLEKNTISLEISDFAYDNTSEDKITVNIELELSGESIEVQEIEEVEEIPVEVNPEEIISMLESDREPDPLEEERQEPIESEEEIIPLEEAEALPMQEVENSKEEIVEEVMSEPEVREDMTESEELIMENVTNEEEYATYHIHLVKSGETVETICTMYNSNLSMLSEYNDLSNISEGEKIIIPETDEK